MQADLRQHWHHLPGDEVLELLETRPDRGLDTFAVEERRLQFGSNVLTRKRQQHPLITFLLQFHQPLIYILIAAGSTTMLLGEWIDTSVIFGVVLVNAVIGYMQEAKAIHAIEALARFMSSEATVIRAGKKQRIDAEALLPGDIVLLQSGDKVPADLRLLRSRELQIDESALTGESLPVHKQLTPLARDTALPDRLNMAYASTLVTHGQATGVVIATGDSTEIGHVQELISNTEQLATPLTRKMAEFSNVLLYVIMALAALTFGVGILRGESWFDMFMAAVALAVGAIPEGLPAAMTITLAIGVSRMAKHHAIIRKLPAVETLGSTSVICSDKTGTLTENQMTVVGIRCGDAAIEVSGIGYAPDGQLTLNGVELSIDASPDLKLCLLAGSLCNDAILIEADGQWRVEGDPTEGALISSSMKGGLHPDALLDDYPQVDVLPFESEHQFMASLHEDMRSARHLIMVKGSLEKLLARCKDEYSANAASQPLRTEFWHRQAESMAAEGLRVLAFAFREATPEQQTLAHSDITGLTLIGLQGMIDPPRPEAVHAVEVCQRAGIQVKMITGDHAVTAATIADRIGLQGEREADGRLVVISGPELEAMSDAELTARVNRIAVFARVAPEQKLRLVKALQANGHVVAMTGDGINDAPALRRADIGTAMGRGGTEVAKEAADMVLTQDNFAAIEAAVEEGRGVYDNLVKFIAWTLPTNLGEGMVILAAIMAGATLPILPVQILWINMTTAVLLGLMLAFEPKEQGLMLRLPRAPDQPVLTRELVGRIVLVGVLLLIGAFGLFEWELQHGESEAAARTVAVNVFVFVELIYLFNCRSLSQSMISQGLFSNRWLLAGVLLMIVLQLLFTYLPVMNIAFSSEPIGWPEWLLILAFSLMVYGIVGLEKWWRRKTSATPSV
ncbi:MAG: carbonate dehydratase [Zetaproteobacteria bacterium CG06_land_8_20_14_3_00_59_53]|nr:MAG: carbonate dehydratase [Zetaproteobacteria bacterium CG2_30_59_37]PIO90560.1 MAG: carbonate dehydratase [Zetaproteobacteria bacterium CG23_combo_of_CG06-09_8_20_14_all_59_86]PIQ66172.1 MAG: carbonate dehydratase [Zetaproteobacteria bacterium CG11_big_fil_rev_8_21_14_0_20_59_439]PIU71508.1 MAG: carbonate dehydratase [Zetaproteobacteria bacterium CG06_land_8_20_14_3_00_59_53]PIU97767.1 MAG: carbonate dehydratase [Zetaproteobacteria bacterium CG03_land_8_20_14_0_80_59_51]PIY47335.1 MAG: ca